VTPVTDIVSPTALLISHFADGGGWDTQVMLINTTDEKIRGTVRFYGEGSDTVAATPVALTVNGITGDSFNYAIPARGSTNLHTSGAADVVAQVGSVRIMPDDDSTAPAAFTIFSFSNNGVTVSAASVEAQPPGRAFRMYTEVNSTVPGSGAIQSGIAVANSSSTAATVQVELTSMDGVNSGFRATIVVPPFGHASRFVHELFTGLKGPIRGVLRLSSSNLISVVSLRMSYNERRDFLITSMPATNEASQATTAPLIFPHIVDRGGYTTEFILFNYIAGQTPRGTLRFFGQNHQALNLNVR